MPRTWLTRCGLTCIAFFLTNVAWAASLPPVQPVPVTPRVVALLGPMALPNAQNQGYMVNTTLILGDTQAILVDTGFTDEIGAHLARAVAQIKWRVLSKLWFPNTI